MLRKRNTGHHWREVASAIFFLLCVLPSGQSIEQEFIEVKTQPSPPVQTYSLGPIRVI